MTAINNRNAGRRLVILAISLIAIMGLSTISSMNHAAADGVINAIPVREPEGIAFDSANGNLYVTSSSNSVVVINGAMNTVVGTSIAVGNGAFHIAFDSANWDVYVTNLTDGTVSVIDGATNVVVATIPVGSFARDIAVNPANGNVYVSVSFPVNSVVIINGTTNKVVGTPIPAGINPDHIAYDSANGNLYVTSTGDNIVTVINDTTNAVVGTPIPVGNAPAGIAFDSINGKLYVTNNGNNTVAAIDGSANTVVATIPVGSRPGDIAFDSANGNLYVINTGDNTVSVISGSTNKVVGTPIPVGNGAEQIAFDSTNGNLYVTRHDDNVVSVISPSAPFPSPPPPLTNPQAVKFDIDQCGGIGCGLGKVICPNGSVESPDTPFFQFEANNSAGDSHATGSWSSVLGGAAGGFSDSGAIKQLHFNGTHFEARGNWVGFNQDLTPPSPTTQTVILCPGTPLDDNTMVTISGDCDSHQIDFVATNGVKATFQGKIACTSAQQTLTVNSVDLLGNSLPGVYTVIRSVADGTILKTGFTPFTFTGNAGTEYKVSVANFDGKAFKHWEDGSTSHTRTINLGTTATTIVASYRTGHSLRGFTPLTYNGTNGMPDLTVEAKILNSGSNKTLHMWTLISPQTSSSALGTATATYRVYATNGYQNLVFDHWGDSGSTDRIRDITISKDTTITTYYRTG